MDPIAPRLLLPYDDEEIRRLYRLATSQGDEDSVWFPRRSPAAVADQVLYLLSIATFVGLTSESLVAGLLALGLGMIGAGLVLALWPNLHVYGPFGALVYCVSKAVPVSTEDPQVLATVVGYVVAQAERRAHGLQSRISESRMRLKSALSDLPALVRAFDAEIAEVLDDSLRLLLASRRDAAERALARVQELDAELARQHEQTDGAVAPLREMQARFRRYRQLSDALSRIEEAQGVAARAEEEAENHRLELQALGETVTRAEERLTDIQRIVDASDRARAELQAALSP